MFTKMKEKVNEFKKTDFLLISNPKYNCSVCGIVESYLDVSIKGYEGKYCMVCWAKWISENLPKLKSINEKKD